MFRETTLPKTKKRFEDTEELCIIKKVVPEMNKEFKHMYSFHDCHDFYLLFNFVIVQNIANATGSVDERLSSKSV